MPSTDVVIPDEIIHPDDAPEPAPWDDPCPVCESRWSAGPERARWGRQHCWRCGYAPGQTAVIVATGPAQPDWAKLVNDAVREAMTSQPQIMANAMTAALGRDGMADLARQQQERLGMGGEPAAIGDQPAAESAMTPDAVALRARLAELEEQTLRARIAELEQQLAKDTPEVIGDIDAGGGTEPGTGEATS